MDFLFAGLSILVGTGMIISMATFSKLLRVLHTHHRDDWEALGKPTGFGFHPEGVFDWKGLDASQRLSLKLLMGIPKEIARHPVPRRHASIIRALNFLLIPAMAFLMFLTLGQAGRVARLKLLPKNMNLKTTITFVASLGIILATGEEPKRDPTWAHATGMEEFTLTTQNPTNQKWKVRLVKITEKGTTTIERTDTKIQTSANPSEHFPEGFGMLGLQLLKANFEKQEAVFSRTFAFGLAKNEFTLTKENPVSERWRIRLVSVNKQGIPTVENLDTKTRLSADDSGSFSSNDTGFSGLELLKADFEKQEAVFTMIYAID